MPKNKTKLTANTWRFLLVGVVIELCVGISYAWSVFQNPLIIKYGWSAAAVSLAFTISTATGVLAPYAAKLQDYFRPSRIVLAGSILFGAGLVGTGFSNSIPMLYIFYGLCAGLGICLIYPMVISFMVKHFPDHKGLVSGIMAASFGCGAIIWAPTGALLTSRFGISKAFIILGIGLMVIIAFFSRFLEKTPVASSLNTALKTALNSQKQAVEKPWKQMLKTPDFFILFLMFTTGTTAGLMIIAHASPIVQKTLGMTPQQASLTVSLLAASSALGKLTWGAISDKAGRYRVLLILCSLVAISMFVLFSEPSTAIFMTALVIIELCYGGFIALIAPLTADTFGTVNLTINYGIMFTCFAFGGIVGPIIASVMKDANNGSYKYAYFIAGFLSLLGLVLAITATIRRKKSKKSAQFY